MGKKSELFSKQKHDNHFDGAPRAKAKFSANRADGSMKSHPQERMRGANIPND